VPLEMRALEAQRRLSGTHHDTAPRDELPA